MGCPAVGGVFVQTEVAADVLRITHALEYAHVLAAGEDIRTPHAAVHVQHMAGGIGLLVQLLFLHAPRLGLHEVAPDQRCVRHVPAAAHGHGTHGDEVKIAGQIFFTVLPATFVIIKQVEGIAVGVVGINAIARKAAAQTVGAVVHGLHGANDHVAADPLSLFMEKSRDSAAGGDTNLSLKGPPLVRASFLRVKGVLHSCVLLHAKKAFTPFPLHAEKEKEQTPLFATKCIIGAHVLHVNPTACTFIVLQDELPPDVSSAFSRSAPD